jgi:hypothetical protein
MKAMAVTRQKASSERFSQVCSPIQYVTENGFSIIRQSEVDGLENDTPRECRFRVRNERDWEHEVTVHFAESLVAQIQSLRRTRLSETSVLWLICAEQCLAAYLRENGCYPEGGQLNVQELSVDALLLATHWSDQQGD